MYGPHVESIKENYHEFIENETIPHDQIYNQDESGLSDGILPSITLD